MKKLFALILLGALLLGMGACKPKADQDQNQTQGGNTTNSPFNRQNVDEALDEG